MLGDILRLPPVIKFNRINNGRAIALVALIAGQFLILLRNAFIARLLGPEQFGIAATFILLQQFLESSTDTGINKFILSSKSGYTKSSISTLHFISFWRSALLALIVVAVAFPLFYANNLVDTIVPFIFVSIALLITGLSNFDIIRVQRQDELRPSSIINITSEVVATATAFIALHFDQSFMVVIYVILAKAGVAAGMSHCLSRRRYRRKYVRSRTQEVWAFATPLILNGPLIFFASQADRLIVAAALAPAILGVYTAVLMLIYTPSGLLARYLGLIFLPILSRQIQATGRPNQRSFAIIVVGVAVAMIVGFGLLGPTMIVWIFGPRYELGWLPVALIGASQAIRFMRLWPSTIALAYGITGSLFAANLLRTLVIPLCLLGLWWEGGLVGLCLGVMSGEAIALMFSFWNNRRVIRRKQSEGQSQ